MLAHSLIMKPSLLIFVVSIMSDIKGIISFKEMLKYCCETIHYSFAFPLVLSAGVFLTNTKQVFQTPTDLLTYPEHTVNLTFSHQIQNYDTILWYQRLKGDTSLRLVGYMYYSNPTVEEEFKDNFAVSGNGEKMAHLQILKATFKDNGEYFGAARMPQPQQQ